MRAVHGFWSQQHGLCLWAEDPYRRVKSPSQALRSARHHPFAVPADNLAEMHGGKPATATLLLPSLLTAPLDSPELVRITPRPEPRRQPALLPWTVPVVTFDPAAASAVLEEPADELRFGASIQYLGELVTFAGELAERGRVLPTISESSDGYSARWRPVLQGPDIVAVQGLVAAMPPVCRAEARATPPEEAGQSPTDLFNDALGALVDAAVRRRLAGVALLPPQKGRRRDSVVEAWLRALSGQDGRFNSEDGEIDHLAGALAPWDGFGTGQRGPARATFRLVEAFQPSLPYEEDDEPADDEPLEDEAPPQDEARSGGAVADGDGSEPRWWLEFLLQSVEDPSLLVPAEQVWTAVDGLGRWLQRPDELLLGELGRASAVYPELTGALHQARPTALELDAEGVYDFLSARAAMLDQAGFGVLIPSWWTKRRTLGLTASASTPQEREVGGGIFSRESLARFEWQLAIGDEPLTEEDLQLLAATKAPLVRLRGEWVAVDPEQIRRALQFLENASEGPETAADVIALARSHPDDLDTPLPVTAVHADGWLGDLLSGVAERSLEPVESPPEFGATLRPYQQRGLAWLRFLSDLGLGACLADDMGLGKTVQLLALESLRRQDGVETRPTLLLCPMSLVGNWQREAARFAPALRIYPHHGPTRSHGEELEQRLADTDIVVTTYQTATRDIEELEDHRWERVVLDEAQAIKNSLSRAAKAVRRLEAAHRVALTGTPMENRLAELWSIMDFLNPGMLGSRELFRARYAKPVELYGQTEPAERLRTVTCPYILRRLKTDKGIIDDLPDKIEVKQYCHLTTEQASLYQSVVDEMMPRIENSDGIERRGNVLATMTKLKQVCNHPAQLLSDHSPVGRRSGKVTRLEEILEEILAEGDRVLLFTQYTQFAELLLSHLSARFRQDVLYLHGGMPKKRRDEAVERFQSDGGPPIFLLSLKAGGTGLNLTAANHVIHLDRWWNPAVEDQATDRAFRIGQKRHVQVRKFICTGTLEEKIDDMIEEKKALANLVVNDGEGWLTELSTGDLRAIFTLSAEAVGE